MTTARVAINGFGRIGRLTLRAMLERHKHGLKRSSPSTTWRTCKPMRTCFALRLDLRRISGPG